MFFLHKLQMTSVSKCRPLVVLQELVTITAMKTHNSMRLDLRFYTFYVQ